MVEQTDDYYRARLVADYDRLIGAFDEGIVKAGDTFGIWLTPMDGKLVAAALRTAKAASVESDRAWQMQDALFRILDIAEGDGTARAQPRIADTAREALGGVAKRDYQPAPEVRRTHSG